MAFLPDAPPPVPRARASDVTVDPRALDDRMAAFPARPSLAPLARWWREVAEGRRHGNRHVARLLMRAVERHKRLLEPFSDPDELVPHQDVLDDLFSSVFPAALEETHCAVALVPFRFRLIQATPAFRRHLLDSAGRPRTRDPRDLVRLNEVTVLNAYVAILRRLYGMECELGQDFVATTACPLRGLEIHFEFHVNLDFLDIDAPDGLPPLDERARARIRQDITDLGVLRELLPMERFRFEGLVVLEARDVTTQEALSGIKQALIDHNSLLAGEHLGSVQEKLRSLLGLPRLAMRVGAIQGREVLMFAPPSGAPPCDVGPPQEDAAPGRGRPADSLTLERPDGDALLALLEGTACVSLKDFGRICGGPAGATSSSEGIPTEAILVEDLGQGSPGCSRQACLLAAGFRSCLFAPLVVDGTTVGVLELASPGVGDLNPSKLLRLREALSLFALAVRRTIDGMDVRIQAVIKEQFTSIHPAVEWRFRRSALAFIRAGCEGPLEAIAFPEVQALFGVSDIRSSSTLRNQAIRADLVEQLTLAREALGAAEDSPSLPYLGEMAYRIERRLDGLAPGLASGDEGAIVEFLKGEVEPMLERVQGFGDEARALVERYRGALDERLGILYRRRRDYEESVADIADAIATYLAEEQARVQAVFPHYFEMHRTDGVDHGIYVGASMAEDPSAFDDLYVRNLRLWQLRAMCVVARRTEEMRSRLKLPLETAHLVLVQHQPLSIRFNPEEKQFTVDGAYNVRYEIIKKRIDKAEIRGTGERLTQPRTIAVVYSLPREAEEYRRHLEYLGARGHIEGPIESHDLGEMQGVQGLKALRASVAMAPRPEETLEMDAPALMEAPRART